MSKFSKNSFSFALVGTVLFGLVAAQGCSSDNQAAPAVGGGGATSHAGAGGAGGKVNNAGSGGKVNNAGSGGKVNNAGTGNAAEGGDVGMGGEGGAAGGPPEMPCDQSFDNGTLTAITDHGGTLPPLP